LEHRKWALLPTPASDSEHELPDSEHESSESNSFLRDGVGMFCDFDLRGTCFASRDSWGLWGLWVSGGVWGSETSRTSGGSWSSGSSKMSKQRCQKSDDDQGIVVPSLCFLDR
jgi:hypothetical protein